MKSLNIFHDFKHPLCQLTVYMAIKPMYVFYLQTPSMNTLKRLSDQRNPLMLILEKCGISTRQGTHALVNTGYYANKYDISLENYPYASIAEGLSLTLPLYPQMTEIEQDYVIENLIKGFECVV